MNEVFICYGRSDSQDVTGRIYDHLSRCFGNDHIFKDVESIKAGDDFRSTIARSLSGTRCILVIIGDQWLGKDANGTLYIANENDYVGTEIRYAIKQEITIIPVLVEGAKMPRHKSCQRT